MMAVGADSGSHAATDSQTCPPQTRTAQIHAVMVVIQEAGGRSGPIRAPGMSSGTRSQVHERPVQSPLVGIMPPRERRSGARSKPHRACLHGVDVVATRKVIDHVVAAGRKGTESSQIAVTEGMARRSADTMVADEAASADGVASAQVTADMMATSDGSAADMVAATDGSATDVVAAAEATATNMMAATKTAAAEATATYMMATSTAESAAAEPAMVAASSKPASAKATPHVATASAKSSPTTAAVAVTGRCSARGGSEDGDRQSKTQHRVFLDRHRIDSSSWRGPRQTYSIRIHRNPWMTARPRLPKSNRSKRQKTANRQGFPTRDLRVVNLAPIPGLGMVPCRRLARKSALNGGP